MATVMKPSSTRDRDRQVGLVEQASALVRYGRRVEPGGPGRDTGRAIGVLSELTSGLPRLLMELSSELLAQLDAEGLGFVPGEEAYPSVEAAVGVARFALAEATTAAHVLARRLGDTDRVMAIITTTANGDS